MDANDGPMSQRRDDPRLRAKALQEGLVREKFGGEHFDGHETLQRRLSSQVDRSHPTLAQPLDDLELVPGGFGEPLLHQVRARLFGGSVGPRHVPIARAAKAAEDVPYAQQRITALTLRLARAGPFADATNRQDGFLGVSHLVTAMRTERPIIRERL